MKKLTVAEIRKNALERFNEEYIHDEQKARNLVNRYYRLASAEYRHFLLDNDERTYNMRYTFELEEKNEKARKRLNADLAVYGLHLAYYGLYPTLETNDGRQTTALTTAWY